MEIKTLRVLALEIFKTSNNLNSHRIVLTENTIFCTQSKYIKLSDSSLRALGPYTWSFLPENIKSTPFVIIFKDFIKNWFRPNVNVSCASK